MVDMKNIFISHVHEDDNLLPNLKKLIADAGMQVRDGSINSSNPNNAKSEEYIKSQILAPMVNWASTLVVLISNETASSNYVNWEIEYAHKQDKQIVGVFAQGATDADVPDALKRYGDSVIVGWQGERVVDAINGELYDWDNPETGNPRDPEWVLTRIKCQQ